MIWWQIVELKATIPLVHKEFRGNEAFAERRIKRLSALLQSADRSDAYRRYLLTPIERVEHR